METQSFNTSEACSLCLEKSNSDLNPLTAESQLESLYYKNILETGTIDYMDIHLFACNKCLQQLKSFQNFIKTCKSSYEFIKSKCPKEKQEETIKEEQEVIITELHEEVVIKEEQHDIHSEIDVSDCNNFEETKDTEPKKLKYPQSRANICSICDKQFPYPSYLNRHMSVHTGYAPFKCSFCDKRMLYKNHLKDHELTHIGEKQYVCLICYKAFSRCNVLNAHMKKKHADCKEQCEICEKAFYSPSDLRVHMRIHRPHKYKCTLCDKGFPSSSNYNSHMITHSDKRSFICKHCGNAFKRSQSLRQHEAIHTRREAVALSIV